MLVWYIYQTYIAPRWGRREGMVAQGSPVQEVPVPIKLKGQPGASEGGTEITAVP